MNTRRRHGPRSNEDGVYLGPSQTQSQLLQQPDAHLPASVPLAPLIDLGGGSCRDRTVEFESVCRSLQGRQVSLIESEVVITVEATRDNLYSCYLIDILVIN